jgi:predicted CXXCH cytochrome family protein
MRYGLTSLLLAMLSVLALPAFADESAGKSFVLWSGSAADDSCVTAECHAILGRAKYVHAPVAEGDCMACHNATDQPHPGDGSIELVEEEPGLCLQCHENPAEGMAFPHSALEEGCTGCHSPHQGGLPKFVLQSGGELCLICHDYVKDGKYVHGPVKANNCQMCHGIHGGEHEAMLNLPGKENCLACHAQIRKIMDNAVSQHEPVANGVCWDCHAPHSSDYKPFLWANYPQEVYASFDEESYALCFGCHDKTAFTYDLTSEATNFRNRNDNLHYFHVNRQEKGRVCKACHGVHGGDQVKLLNTRAGRFGRWGIPVYFTQTETGGGCMVGCHGPKAYDILQKVKND